MVRLWGDHIVISSLFIGLAISLAFVALTFVTIEVLAKHVAIIAEKMELSRRIVSNIVFRG